MGTRKKRHVVVFSVTFLFFLLYSIAATLFSVADIFIVYNNSFIDFSTGTGRPTCSKKLNNKLRGSASYPIRSSQFLWPLNNGKLDQINKRFDYIEGEVV